MDKHITGVIRRAQVIVLKRARIYGDPIMRDLMGLDTAAMGTGNFQNIALWTARGGFGAVTQFQTLDRAALQYLISIQPQDGQPLNEKMNFLIGERVAGAPTHAYWTEGGEWKDLLAGDTTVKLKFGTIVYGGQLCQAEAGERVFTGQYQNTNRQEQITFYKPIGLRKSQWGRPVAEFMAEGLIQKATWAEYPSNEYHDTVNSGIVLHPVWSELDYPCNNGALWLAKAFTV